jgi:hypothetical protein
MQEVYPKNVDRNHQIFQHFQGWRYRPQVISLLPATEFYQVDAQRRQVHELGRRDCVVDS